MRYKTAKIWVDGIWRRGGYDNHTEKYYYFVADKKIVMDEPPKFAREYKKVQQ